MKCHKCGTELSEGMIFCRKCGTPITDEAQKIREESNAKKEEKRIEANKKSLKEGLTLAIAIISVFCLGCIIIFLVSFTQSLKDKNLIPKKKLTEEQLEEISYKASESECITYEGEITQEQTKNVFEFTASTKGVYGLEWIVPKDEQTKAHVSVYDSNGQKIAGIMATMSREQETIGNLDSGDKIQIEIERDVIFDAGGKYKINIWNPKESADVTGYTVIEDSIQYQNQVNTYMYTVQRDGLTLGGKIDDESIKVSVYDKDDNEIYSYHMHKDVKNIETIDGVAKGDEIKIVVIGDGSVNSKGNPYKIVIQ